MTTFLISVVQATFRPSVAALSIALAVAIVTIENSPRSVKRDTINLSQLGCGGMLKLVCDIRLF